MGNLENVRGFQPASFLPFDPTETPLFLLFLPFFFQKLVLQGLALSWLSSKVLAVN